MNLKSENFVIFRRITRSLLQKYFNMINHHQTLSWVMSVIVVCCLRPEAKWNLKKSFLSLSLTQDFNNKLFIIWISIQRCRRTSRFRWMFNRFEIFLLQPWCIFSQCWNEWTQIFHLYLELFNQINNSTTNDKQQEERFEYYWKGVWHNEELRVPL